MRVRPAAHAAGFRAVIPIRAFLIFGREVIPVRSPLQRPVLLLRCTTIGFVFI
jgi:hypothetical protein